MKSLKNDGPGLVIVLDALDGCDEADGRILVRVIAGSLSSLLSPIKFFVTSRMECHLNQAFRSCNMVPIVEHHLLQDEDRG